MNLRDYAAHLATLTPKQLQLMLVRERQRMSEPLAIVGTGCRLPGGIHSAPALWDFLERGECAVEHYPSGPPGAGGHPRWRPGQYGAEPALATGGFMAGLDQFDPATFGIGEDEAMFMDPQHRLLAQCAREAIQDAGLPPDALRGQSVGVFVGMSSAEYLYAAMCNGLVPEALSPYMGTGTALSAAAGRIAMTLGGRGPVMAVDTACSSALTALHLAQGAIRRGECDWAIVAASHLLLSPLTSLVFARAGMLSSLGQSRPFDAGADGHVRGEGCGVVLVCRQSLARERDLTMQALLRGTALHQHGDRPAMSVSSSQAQVQVIREALEHSELGPGDIHFIEAQGTGSRLGGLVELEALHEVFGRDRAADAPLYVGSAKANLGHLEAASGIPSLLKAIGALSRRVLPPQIHFDVPDSGFAWTRSGLRVADRAVTINGEGPVRCGVSSFGFTGTHAHVILESAPGNGPRPAPRMHDNSPGRSYWPPNNHWNPIAP